MAACSFAPAPPQSLKQLFDLSQSMSVDDGLEQIVDSVQKQIMVDVFKIRCYVRFVMVQRK